eukprot:CAMPEP_0194303126 /NCGR_PEP_ID=MMETSP0171-20130528/1072_1 /TAXON_ID=218684 /ORGANISM="Corethron pennatum, Strain L29A3" /LENGTH=62 /DNA_ID=CAMNT_0039053913 /DNA_START=98 /DNA_END=286 /DNA_ORIENTATION=-
MKVLHILPRPPGLAGEHVDCITLFRADHQGVAHNGDTISKAAGAGGQQERHESAFQSRRISG